jgi:Fe-S cluster biogenesis protein NfuA
MESGTRDFADPEEAAASPLAEALFSLGDVVGVFFGREFISVTAAPGVAWGGLKPRRAVDLTRPFFPPKCRFSILHKPGFSVPSADAELPLDAPEDAEIVEQIKELIETRVRPCCGERWRRYRFIAVFQGGVVYLQMQGACSGCPSSTANAQKTVSSSCSNIMCPKSAKSRAA